MRRRKAKPTPCGLYHIRLSPPNVVPSTNVHQHAPSTPFQCLKRGESLTYGIGETLTYDRGVTQTDFEGLATGA